MLRPLGTASTRPPDAGFSLLEAIFTLAIITLLSVGLVSVSAAAFNSVRRAATDDHLRALERAISGDPVIVLNEARTSFGFVGDMGTLPVSLEDLWVKGSQTAFSFDTAKKAGAGWTGPYLETDIVESIEATGFDAWGTALSYSNTPFLDSDFGANALGKLISFGSDGIAGGTDDITLHFFDAEIQSRVQGFVRDDDKNGVPGVGVTVNYPQSGALTSQTLVVIGILAAVLTPMVGSMIEDARVTAAQRDVQEIAKAIQNFRKNTGKWPIFVSGVSITTSSTVYDVLLGPGSDPEPAGSAWLTGSRGDADAILMRNTPSYTTSGRFKWRGPYIAELLSDPWGNAYLINTKSLKFGVKEAGLVLSAGPNATIDTTFQQTIGSGSSDVVIGVDDIAARIR